MTDQLQMLLRQLTISQRIGIVFGSFVSVVLLLAFVMWAGKPDMQPAFSRLSTTDAGAISEALRSAKIPFEVADAGSTILVPASQLASARVAAASAGVATDSTDGFSLFDKTGFGQSEFDQQVTYQRAIEGKLSKTIGEMSGVAEAKVSIVAAQQGLFADQSRPATASIVLKMRNGQPPDKAMVRGIVNTIAGAVAGLTPANVTVVDENGRMLAGPEDQLSGDAMATEQAVERSLSTKVQDLVDQALGPGHASVAVAATLDMDKVEQQVTTVAPVNTGNWTPVSVSKTEEHYSGTGAPGALGIAGSGSNVPGLTTYPGQLPVGSPATTTTTASPAPSASPGAGSSPSPSSSPGASPSPAPAASAETASSGYTKTQETVNYNLSQTVEKIIKQPGTIKRLSVAVLLDQAALGSISPDGIKSSIEAAIGADPTRGDLVSVSAVPFKAAAAAGGSASGAAPPAQMMDQLAGAASTALGVLVALVLLFLVWRNLRALRRQAEDMQLYPTQPSTPELLEAYTSSGQQIQLAPMSDLDNSPQAKIQERLRVVAEDKPDAIVGLVNGWLREDQRR